MKTINATKARKNFFEMLNQVSRPSVSYAITKNGETQAVLVNFDEYESLKETVEIMANNKLVKEIEEGIKEIKQGKVSTYEEVFGHPQSAVADKKTKYSK